MISKALLAAKDKVHIALTEKRILEDLMNTTEFSHMDAPNSGHFVKLNSTFQDKDNLFFVLEYCQGGDLLSLFETRSEELDEKAVQFYAANIVVILETLHENNVVHRDIKPENFLIDDQGFLKLIDFGLSKDKMNRRMRSRAFTLTGTSEFMAPEVLEQTAEGYNFPYDWWSFGCLLYDMLIGHTPFHSLSFDMLKQNILTSEPRFPSHINENSRSIIQLLLEKNPSKRQTSADCLRDHPFFEGVDWSIFETRDSLKITPPYIPDKVARF